MCSNFPTLVHAVGHTRAMFPTTLAAALQLQGHLYVMQLVSDYFCHDCVRAGCMEQSTAKSVFCLKRKDEVLNKVTF